MRLSVTNVAAMLFVMGTAFCVQAQSTMYWTNTAAGKVHRMTLPDGVSEEVLSGVLHQPRDINVDLDGGKMYWLGFRTVRRANLDGRGIEDLAETNNPRVLALGPASGWIYWAGDYAIQRMRLDGASRMVVVDSTYANGLAVDADEGKLYWTNGGSWGDDGRVYQASVMGADVRVFASGQNYPGDLALDFDRRLLFWSVGHGVMQAQLDGSVMGLTVSTDNAHVRSEHKGGWIDQIALDVAQERLYFSIQGVVYRNLGNREVAMLPVESDLGFSGFAVAGGDLYWTDDEQGAIQRLDLATNEAVALIGSEVLDPQHLVIDSQEQKIYWTESNWIKRADLDGSNVENLVGPIFHMELTDLALDPVNRKMYWSTWNGWGPHHDGGVYRSNLDGTEIDSLYFGGTFALALDPEREKMYIGDGWFDDDSHWVKEANLDGSYAREMFGSSVSTITFDAGARMLYYHARNVAHDASGYTVYGPRGKIVRSAIDGSSERVLSEHFQTFDVKGLALDLLEQKLYWTENTVDNESGKSRIRRSDLVGKNVEDIVASMDGEFGDVAIVSQEVLATGISAEEPTSFTLSSAYPNPFNPSTTIRYALASTQRVTLKVRDALGRLIAILTDQVQPAGPHSVQWIPESDTPSGSYFYTLETSEGAVTRSMTLLR